MKKAKRCQIQIRLRRVEFFDNKNLTMFVRVIEEMGIAEDRKQDRKSLES